MKNKKLTYVLLPMVLLIWGAILYRIVNVVGDNEGVISPSSVQHQPMQPIVQDTFALLLSYRDPFLGKMPATKTPGNTGPKPIVPVVVTPEKPIVWPAISYGGRIKSEEGNRQLVFVQINGQANIMKIGDMINEITLNSVSKDSIEVQFGKYKKVIYK